MLAQTTVNSLQLLVKNPIGTSSSYDQPTLFTGQLSVPAHWCCGKVLAESFKAFVVLFNSGNEKAQGFVERSVRFGRAREFLRRLL